MALTATRRMTFEEFEKLPQPRNGRYELHRGEVIFVGIPTHGHHLVQYTMRGRMEEIAGDAGAVSTEFGFRPLPEHEYWVADVVFVSKERWNNIPRDGQLMGAPDLVVEVLSPSNTAAEMREKKKLCLENGSREFWIVDIDLREVEVSTPDGHGVTYKSGQEIPLFFATGARVAVDSIFA